MNKILIMALVGLLLVNAVMVSANTTSDMIETSKISLYKQLPINYNIGLIDPISLRQGRVKIINFRYIIDTILFKMQ